jgi:hypothetical protein
LAGSEIRFLNHQKLKQVNTKKLAHGPIFTVVTYQGYNINGYTFYTEQQDKKSTYKDSGVRVDAYDVMGQDKNMYHG